jgi:hypothetical protein
VPISCQLWNTIKKTRAINFLRHIEYCIYCSQSSNFKVQKDCRFIFLIIAQPFMYKLEVLYGDRPLKRLKRLLRCFYEIGKVCSWIPRFETSPSWKFQGSLNWLSTMPWRRIGEWRYSSTHSWPRHYMEWVVSFTTRPLYPR